MQAMLQKRQQLKLSETGRSDTCPLCQDTGWVPYVKEGREYYGDCPNGCRTKMIKSNKLEFADIPEEFKHLTVESFNVDIYSSPDAREKAAMVKTICLNYINEFQNITEMGKGLYLYSMEKGSGKTRMAVSIANDIINTHMVSAKFISAISILHEIKSTWNSKDSTYTEKELLDSIKKIPVLVIDDIGVEKTSPWVDEQFYGIIDARLISKKITIFTSNKKIEELCLDERVKSRIGKMALPLSFPNESIRGNLTRRENEDLLNKLLLG
jgi:DNA replication protein DnaC